MAQPVTGGLAVPPAVSESFPAMGKRSDFPRVKRDFYPTPEAAVQPLLPHIDADSSFIEPCAGAGDLVAHLTAAGHRCMWAFDIEPMAKCVKTFDAFDMRLLPWGGDYIITNPPWSRSVLHPMIVHFSDQRPTWLLFDADWVHTKQASPYLSRLRKIVSIGRVKWIPDSTMTGKDNCAWHLFTKPDDKPAQFFGRCA